jgi:uncharacterized protein
MLARGPIGGYRPKAAVSPMAMSTAMAMRLLIDGYNLVYTMGVGRGPGAVDRARERMLATLGSRLDESIAVATVVVFDAKRAPEGGAVQREPSGITVRYAVGYPEADDLLEELIQKCGIPKQLMVVSSDRRVREAARRKRAKDCDAERWWCRLLDGRVTLTADSPNDRQSRSPIQDGRADRSATGQGERSARSAAASEPPAIGAPSDREPIDGGTMDPSEVQRWLRYFERSRPDDE